MLNFSGNNIFSISRLLPLPSSDWRDFSQDWFCGCCEGHKQAAIEDVDKHLSAATGGFNDTCVTSNKHDLSIGVQTVNKQLTIANTDPKRKGDVFYTCSALYLLWQNFGIQNVEDLKNSQIFLTTDIGSVCCRKCEAELGLCDMKNGLFQFWHHGIVVSNQPSSQQQHQTERKAGETFFRMVVGIVHENMDQSVKIYFSTKIHRLFVWVIEPKLLLLSGKSIGTGDVCPLPKTRRAMKVIYQVEI